MISIVIPIYNEEEVIERLHRSVRSVMDTLSEDWEVVYVNDGSGDLSLELLLGLQRVDRHVVVIELSRNWGHQAALTAGISAARGDAVILMDGDMQDPASVIPDLVAAWRRGAQVVVAERSSRAERGVRGWLFRSFYKILGALSDYPIPLNAGIFGLLDRQAANAVAQLTETNRYLPGLRAWVGFPTAVVAYERVERAAGQPKQTFWKLLRYGLDAIFSFSYKPLRLSLFVGLFVAFFAMLYGAALICCRLFGVGMFGIPVVDGYTTTIVAILFLGGVQLISIGILGEYLGRVYDEVKRRPLYLVRRIHQSSPSHEQPRVREPGPPRPPALVLPGQAGDGPALDPSPPRLAGR
jgi:glycosyltransferase involved in cell wall biosynthesis